MTRKIYKSAMGKTVDLGALILENENVRAVGNMGVNARGDILDSANQTIDTKNRQVQRQYNKQATVARSLPSTSTRAAKQPATLVDVEILTESIEDPIVEETVEVVAQPEPVAEETTTPVPRGGLAAALAKSQAVKQELMKTPRQLAQEKAGVKKI